MARKRKSDFDKNREIEKKIIHTLMENDAVEFLQQAIDQDTMLTDKDKAKEFLENTKEKIDELIDDLDQL